MWTNPSHLPSLFLLKLGDKINTHLRDSKVGLPQLILMLSSATMHYIYYEYKIRVRNLTFGEMHLLNFPSSGQVGADSYSPRSDCDRLENHDLYRLMLSAKTKDPPQGDNLSFLNLTLCHMICWSKWIEMYVLPYLISFNTKRFRTITHLGIPCPSWSILEGPRQTIVVLRSPDRR